MEEAPAGTCLGRVSGVSRKCLGSVSEAAARACSSLSPNWSLPTQPTKAVLPGLPITHCATRIEFCVAPPAMYSTGCDSASSAYLQDVRSRRWGAGGAAAAARACVAHRLVLVLGEDGVVELRAPLVEDVLLDDRRDVEQRVAEADELGIRHCCEEGGEETHRGGWGRRWRGGAGEAGGVAGGHSSAGCFSEHEEAQVSRCRGGFSEP